jgi:hypothetical protein
LPSTRYRDIGIVLFVLFNVVLWPSLILFLARRKLFPVANRFPYQVVALDAVLLIWTTSLCFRLIYRFDYTCGLLVWSVVFESAGEKVGRITQTREI